MISRKSSAIEPFLVMEVMEKAAEMERRGEHIIHLEVGELDFDTPRCIKDAAFEAISSGKTRYTHSLGLVELREAIDLISSGYFSHGDHQLFHPLVASILYRDEYLLLADYCSYVDRQDEAGDIFRDEKRWTRMSILNAARMGKFSSDRAIRRYCEKVWRVEPLR